MKRYTYIVVSLVIIAVCAYIVVAHTDVLKATANNHKNTTYTIEGEEILLEKGVSIKTDASGTTVTTRYFGNELLTDLDGDGVEDDIAFILTQDRGGSGTFYYAVGAVATEEGFKGSDGFLLGDRIAPQSVDESPNPRHKNVVVFNYMDREIGEAMTEAPSVGKSAYLKLVPEAMQWAIVEPDFPGESR